MLVVQKSSSIFYILVAVLLSMGGAEALQSAQTPPPRKPATSRRDALGWFVASTAAIGTVSPAWAGSALQDALDVDSFLRSGVDAGGNMGVSSQSGKSKPVTGVFFR